ncbi:MAG TPA: histidine kinase [Thermoanaerobaculia bacterium]|nr:histidine kinase [Thermoanaerobaculia bacterium]
MTSRIKPWMLVSAAWLGPAILGAINEIAQRTLSGSGPASLGSLLFASGDWLVYALFTPGVFRVSARWPLPRHLLVHLGFSLLFSILWAAAGVLLRAWLTPNEVWGGSLGGHFVSWLFITLPFGMAVYLGVVGTEHAIRYFVQKNQLSEQLATARLAALQATVNPHFLFNTLNTIGVLVRDGDREAATHIIEEFSEVMRRMLSRHRPHEVALADELELVRHYLAIEEARFADRLRVRFEVEDDTLAAAVPSFALQQLVENAVRHGIARRAEAGSIVVRATREGDVVTIDVIDDGPGFPAEPRAGHGIENTRERLRALYGERASLTIAPNEPHGTIATLRIPYHELVLESEITE